MWWYRIKSFFKFYWLASTKYNVQSTFLHEFVVHVLDTNKNYYAFEKIENERNKLKSNQEKVDVSDFGAGSVELKSNHRKIAEIANTSLSEPSKCKILFQIANHFQCKTILELGTSLGISSSYLASANSNSVVYTLEGDLSIASKASEVHQSLGLKNIKVTVGKFDDNLLKVCRDIESIDMVFLDGHHQREATMAYYETIRPYCHANTIIVVDDIYWSAGMTDAWQMITDKKDVSLSIDLYDIGIVFLKSELSKQFIRLVPFRYKPWKIGLFG